jgi:hypothetical protein
MTSKQKAREYAFLSEAVALEPTLFTGALVDFERPDFLMNVGGRTIGIEVMEYARGQDAGESLMRRSEAALWQIADKSYQEFKSKYAEPLFVTLQGNPQEPPPRAKLPELSAALVNLVSQHIPQGLYAQIRLDYQQLETTAVQPFIHGITIERMRDDRGSGWRVMSAGFISASISELQGIIDLKNPKVPSYLTRCDEVWLCIVAEGRLGVSGHISFAEEQLLHIYTTDFTRLLFYNRDTRRVHQLKTA